MKNISENRDDEFENCLAGCPILGHEEEIPCLAEGGCFMSSNEYKKIEIGVDNYRMPLWKFRNGRLKMRKMERPDNDGCKRSIKSLLRI